MALQIRQLFFRVNTDSGKTIIIDGYAVQDRFDAAGGLPLTSTDTNDFIRWSKRTLGYDIWNLFYGSLGGLYNSSFVNYPTRKIQWDRVNTAVKEISPLTTELSKLHDETFTIGEHKYRMQSTRNTIETYVESSQTWRDCFTLGVTPSSSGGQLSYQRFAGPVVYCTDAANWKDTIDGSSLNLGMVFGIYGNILDGSDWTWNGELTANIYSYTSYSTYTAQFMTDLFINTPAVNVNNTAYPLLPDSTTGGGGIDGNYNNVSDAMPTNDLYNTSITNGGFLTLFTPTDHEMTTLSNYLWSNSFTDTMKAVFDKIGSLGLSFQDYILSLHRLPVGVPSGPSKIVQLGWYPTNINMTSASAFGGVYDLGSLDIQRYYGNALDYKTRIQIFLPYVGFEDLDTQAVMGKTINLKYVVDYVSGDCQAQIFVDGSIHYQFKGNMSYHLPVGQDNFGDIIQQGIAIGTSMVTGGAAMAAGAVAAKNYVDNLGPKGGQTKASRMYNKEVKQETHIANQAFDNAINQFTMNVGGDITRGGAVGGNSGWFACQVPFIIINRPRLSLPENFGHYHGYPSNITETLGNLQGYTQVGSIHLDDIGCSASEDNELNHVLRKGFIIRDWDITRPNTFTLYHNDSDLDVIGKDLTYLKSINDIRLKDETSRETPTFLLTNIDDVFNSINYLYYPEFDRFYVVDSISSVREGLWALHCSVDVLQTYAARLRNLSAVISRQEYKYNLYLDDGTLASYANVMVQTINFPVSFNNLGSSNILVILGS